MPVGLFTDLASQGQGIPICVSQTRKAKPRTTKQKAVTAIETPLIGTMRGEGEIRIDFARRTPEMVAVGPVLQETP